MTAQVVASKKSVSGKPSQQQAFDMIDALDFSQAKERLQDPKKSMGWSAAKAERVIQEYRRFLKIIATGIRVVPTLSIDEVWHLHILDSSNYRRHCEQIFGRYIDHFPYAAKGGTGGLDDTFQKTAEAYQKLFGESYTRKID